MNHLFQDDNRDEIWQLLTKSTRQIWCKGQNWRHKYKKTWRLSITSNQWSKIPGWRTCLRNIMCCVSLWWIFSSLQLLIHIPNVFHILERNCDGVDIGKVLPVKSFLSGYLPKLLRPTHRFFILQLDNFDRNSFRFYSSTGNKKMAQACLPCLLLFASQSGSCA